MAKKRKEGSGGAREGSGRRKIGSSNETFSLTADEKKLLKRFTGNSKSKAVRFAIRKTYGGCLHDIVEERDDFVLFCISCKKEITEDFKEFTNPQPLPDEYPDADKNPYFDNFL
jgi:glycerol-3-phosphate dehydrogenase